MGKRGRKVREFCDLGHKIAVDGRGKRICPVCHSLRARARYEAGYRNPNIKPLNQAQKNSLKLSGKVSIIFIP